MNNTKERRLGAKIAFALLSLLLFLASCVAALFFFGERGLFGYGARLVLSSSMAEAPPDRLQDGQIETIPLGSLIVIRLVPKETAARKEFYEEIVAGDVLTFRYQTVGGAVTITHRVKSILPKGDGYLIELGGNGTHAGTQTIDTGDAQSGNFVLGKVVFCNLPLGILLCIVRDPFFLALLGAVVLLALALELKRRAKSRARPPLWRGKHEK